MNPFRAFFERRRQRQHERRVAFLHALRDGERDSSYLWHALSGVAPDECIPWSGWAIGEVYLVGEWWERRGFVASRLGDERPAERGYLPRRYWRLTDVGRAVLEIHEALPAVETTLRRLLQKAQEQEAGS